MSQETGREERAVSRLAGLALFCSACAVPVGAAGAAVGLILSHIAWGRCVRDPRLQGKELAGAGLAIGYGIAALSLLGLLAPSLDAYSHHGAFITDQRRRGPIESRVSLDPSSYEVVCKVSASTRSTSYFGLAASGSDANFGSIWEQAAAAGGHDVIDVRRDVAFTNLLGFVRSKEVTLHGTAIRYRVR